MRPRGRAVGPSSPAPFFSRLAPPLNYSTRGIGTKCHFAVELLKLRAGIDVVHVPYASGGQVVQSLLTDTTQLGSAALPAGEPLVRGGTLAGLKSIH